MENFGLIVFASLFVFSGITHIRNHANMVSYTAQSLGDCPVAKYIAPLGGAPTGLFLVVAGVGAAFGEPVALYALAGFLAVVTALFHRNFLRDPGGFKGLSLFGLILAYATHIS